MIVSIVGLKWISLIVYSKELANENFGNLLYRLFQEFSNFNL